MSHPSSLQNHPICREIHTVHRHAFHLPPCLEDLSHVNFYIRNCHFTFLVVKFFSNVGLCWRTPLWKCISQTCISSLLFCCLLLRRWPVLENTTADAQFMSVNTLKFYHIKQYTQRMPNSHFLLFRCLLPRWWFVLENNTTVDVDINNSQAASQECSAGDTNKRSSLEKTTWSA